MMNPARRRVLAACAALVMIALAGPGRAQTAYVPNSDETTVSVIDTVTNTVTAKIGVGYYPTAAAVTPDGSKVYVANTDQGNTQPSTVSVIDTATNALAATIPVDGAPVGVAVTPDGSKVYVSCENSVLVIAAAANTVIAVIPVARPLGLAVTPDGSELYVGNAYLNAVSVIDTATNTITTTIPVGIYPAGMAVTPDGSKLYVANSNANTVSVIDTATSAVAATVTVGNNPEGLAVTPDGSRVYTANWADGSVSVINTATNTVTGSAIPVGYAPYGLSITPDGRQVYVADPYENEIWVLATATNKIVKAVPVGTFPIAFGNFIARTPGPATATMVVSSPDPATWPQSETFTATVGSGGSPVSEGVVSFVSDGNPIAGCIAQAVSGGQATCSAQLAIGSHSVAAVFDGDANFDGSTSSTLTQVVNPAPTATSVSSSSTNPVFGTSITLTATVSGGVSPTGTVTFKDGATTLGTGMVSGTTATFSTASLTVGDHSITAVYGGDANNAGSISSAAIVTVGQVTTTIAVSSSATIPVFGTSITLTATISGGIAPTGAVTFMDGTTTLGTGTVSGTTASFSTAGLAVGGHSIIAVYAGDTDNAGSISSSAIVTVGQTTTMTAVSSSSANPVFGTSITLTAIISGGVSATGTVTFKDGATTLGTGTVSGTTATFPTAGLSVGGHSITAAYAGDTNNAGSTSPATAVSVGQTATMTVVSSSSMTPVFGTSITLTATISGGVSPTGTVIFKDGATTLGTGAVSGTTATFSMASLAVGSHGITAAYAGDTNNAGSTSPAATLTVGQTTTTTTVSSSSANPVFGTSVTLTAIISGGVSATGTVTFKDGATTLGTGTVSGTTASFSTAGLAVGGHSITAVYGGDIDNAGSTSPASIVTIGQVTTTTAVSSSSANPVFGTSITLTATVSGGASPTGTITFKDGATMLGTGMVSGTTATFMTAALAAGSHGITAVYAGDTDNAGSTSSATIVTVGQTTTMTAVSSSLTAPTLGMSITLTATISGGPSLSGIVTFKDGATSLGTGNVSGTIATFSTAGLAVGSHSITAVYAGDGNNAGSISSAVTEIVSPAVAATAAIPSKALTQNHATTAFTPVVGGGGTGTLSYSVSPTLPAGLGMASDTGAIAGTPAATSAAARYTVTVTDANGATGSTSFSLTVNPAVAAAQTVASTSLGAYQATTSFAPVTGSGGTGALQYSVSPSLPAGLAMASATGTISGTPTAPQPATRYTVTVSDTNDATAMASFSLTVGTATSSVAISTSPNRSDYGQAVTFTAIVSGPGGSPAPTGTVTFFEGSKTLSTGMLVGRMSSYTAPALSVGSHIIGVTYSGDSLFAGSSGSVTEIVEPATTQTAGQVYSYLGTLGTAGAALAKTSIAAADSGPLNSPVAGALDSASNHLFVADAGNHRVQVYDTGSLAVVATIGVSGVAGADNAHLDQPEGVGFDPGNFRVFVADTGNHRIQIYDGKSFAYLGTLGAAGSAGADDAHFNAPWSIHADTAGHLYIADSGNQRVQIFDAATLAYVATLGTTGAAGTDNAHFNAPKDAEINPAANQIMVADSGNGRVQLFDATSLAYAGTLGGADLGIASNLHLGTPVTAAYDPTSNLVLFADSGADDRVQVFDALSYGYVLTIGTTGSSGTGSGQFAGPDGVVVDPAHGRVFIGDPMNQRVQIFSIAPPVSFASVLPDSRSVQLGQPATLFASLVNAGATALQNCRMALPVTAPRGLSLTYQTTDPGSNAPTGTPDTPATIAAGNGVQTFLVTLQGSMPFSAAAMPLDFDCLGAAPAAVETGVDTIDLTMSSAPTADIIALAATATHDGIVALPRGGTGAFAVASTNIGIASEITVSADTGSAGLPLGLTLCQSNPSTGQCLATPAPSVTLSFAAQAAPTFSIFAQSKGTAIPFAPASSRIFVRFRDAGALHGSTSVAVETQ